MKKNIAYIILLSLFIFIFSACNKDTTVPKVEKGIIDLSEWDFNTDKVLNLDGEWEFYPNEFINPKSFPKNDNANFVKVPSSWTKYQINDEQLKSYGYATYRIQIIPNKKDTVYKLNINRIDVAFKLWINNVE